MKIISAELTFQLKISPQIEAIIVLKKNKHLTKVNNENVFTSTFKKDGVDL